MNNFLYFPYSELRKGQAEIINTIRNSIERRKNLILEAPSGIGKTIAVLYAIYPYLFEKFKLVYLTRTYREIERVFKELFLLNKNFEIETTLIKGRKELCINEKINNKEFEEFYFLCKKLIQQNKCNYFKNFIIKSNIIENVLKDKKFLSNLNLIDLGLNISCCPYELQKIKILNSKIIISTHYLIYNQEILENFSFPNCILVIDEAHNIIDLALKNLTGNILASDLIFIKNKVKNDDIKDIIEKLLYSFNKLFESNNKSYLKINLYELLNYFEKNYGIDLLNFLKFIINFFEKKATLEDISLIQRIIKIRNFYEKILFSNNEAILFLEDKNNDLFIQIFNFNPSVFLAQFFKKFYNVIFISATLKPFEYFSKLAGLKNNFEFFEVKSEYSPQVLTIIIKSLSTKFEERSPLLYKSLIKILAEISENSKGNIGVFTASYEIIKALIENGLNENIKNPIFIDKPEISNEELSMIINKYKELNNAILISVQGGRVAEGEDFPEEKMDTVVIIGIPFEPPSLLVNEKINYLNKVFEGKGKLYGYIIPAIRKTIQAIGRAFRSPTDKGIVFLIDSRFCSNIIMENLPDWLLKNKIIIEYQENKIKKYLRKYYNIYYS
jgi:DNA excision repair protein ERCC-2